MNNSVNRKRVTKVVICIMLLAAIAYFIAWPWYQIDSTDGMFFAGDFDQGRNILNKYTSNIIWSAKAKKEYKESLILEGSMQMANKEYLAAVDTYRELFDEENEYKAWMGLAEQSIAIGDYEQAVQAYDYANEPQLIMASYEAWGDAYMESFDYEDAIICYNSAQKPEKAKDTAIKYAESVLSENPRKVIGILNGFTGDEIADLMYEALSHEVATNVFDTMPLFMRSNTEDKNKIAETYGAAITDVDTQLTFCRLLEKGGYSLKSVYPNGVLVNINLSDFQIYDYDENAWKIHTNKMICFSRIEEKPKLEARAGSNSTYDIPSSLIYNPDNTYSKEDPVGTEKYNRKTSSDYYTVRLHPEYMEKLKDTLRADSLKECDLFLLIEKGYLPTGLITIRTTTTTANSYYQYSPYNTTKKTTYSYYPYYSAYESVCLYDRRCVGDIDILLAYENEPKLSNCVIGNAYEDAGVDMSTVDIDKIMKALENSDLPTNVQYLATVDPKIIEIVSATNDEYGDYIIVPDKNEIGESVNYKGTTRDIKGWYNEKYALGMFENNWLDEAQMQEVISYINRSYY